MTLAMRWQLFYSMDYIEGSTWCAGKERSVSPNKPRAGSFDRGGNPSRHRAASCLRDLSRHKYFDRYRGEAHVNDFGLASC